MQFMFVQSSRIDRVTKRCGLGLHDLVQYEVSRSLAFLYFSRSYCGSMSPRHPTEVIQTVPRIQPKVEAEDKVNDSS